MNRRSYALRALTAAAAIAVAVALGGCDPEQVRLAKSMRPLSAEMLALIEQKNMAKESPILVRLFKEEAELEVWKQDQNGRFALLKTYPICRWSGELGPKIREGDRQAPEGFYTITQANLNPNSSYYLSINIGYPNEFDKALGRTGAHLMVHGDCSSRGCYAMTDEQMGEIYSLARESFFGGQRAFQIQAYPFRMTALNMAKHRNSPHMAFWRMLKQGSDHFEVSRLQPTVSVCDKRYVFNAEAPANSTTPLKFNPAARCPAYAVDPDLVAAVAEKTRSDETEFTQLARRTPTVAVRTGRDGGMHPTFLARVQREVRDPDGTVRKVIDENAVSTLGSYVNPPRDPDTPPAGPAAATAVVANVPMPRPAPLPKQGAPADAASSGVMSLAAADSRPAAAPTSGSGNFLTNPDTTIGRLGATVGKWIGIGDDKKPASGPKPKPATVAPPKPAPAAKPATMLANQPSPKQQTQNDPAPAPEVRTSNATPPAVMSGAQPVVPADTFESRWAPAR